MERCIILAGLPLEAEQLLAEHARRLGAGTTILQDGRDTAAGGGGHGLVAMPVDGDLSGIAQGAAIAVGRDLDAARQARALAAGAADVIDLAWAPDLVARRLATLLEQHELRDRIAAELAAKRRELADARALQRALVPPPGGDDRLAIDVVLEPAMELGGDLVDHVRIADGRFMLALGDVSGKGAAAALTMARTHTLLRSLALRAYAGDLLSPPDTAARRLNGMLAIENDGCMFVTMFLALLDPRSGGLDYVRCGQIPPFLRRRNGTVERLDAVGGLPLGVADDAVYAVGRTTLEPGDVLLVVSDGVTEAEAAGGRLLGEEPVLDWLAGSPGELGSLVALTRAHEAGEPPSDDLSALLVRMR